MAIDVRDWYVQTQRKRQGYVERAAFRVNLGELERHSRRRRRVLGWLSLAGYFLAFVAAISLAALLVRAFLAR